MVIKNLVFSEFDTRIIDVFSNVIKFSNVFLVVDSLDFKKASALLNSKNITFISVDFDVLINLNKNSFNNLLNKVVLVNVDKFYFEKTFEYSHYNSLVYSLYLLKKGFFDTYVGGAIETSASLVRDSIHIIGVQKNVKRISSFFIMLNKEITKEIILKKSFSTQMKKSFFFSDCAVQISPDHNQLFEIAKLTSNNALQVHPKLNVALLSYSTNVSGSGASVETVSNASKLLIKSFSKSNNVSIDGPIQADTALSSFVRKQKKSKLKSDANVFIFPNLDSANISYKLVSYLADYSAIGPILQGLNCNVCDLSRGVKSDEILILCKIISKYSFV